MKKLLLLLVISLSTASYSQTPITDANFQQAINTCLSTNPEDGLCSDSEYGGMPDWDVSNVTDMDSAFKEKTTFNGDISNWDVSNVTTMQLMFSGAEAYNQPINSWNVEKVVNMENMFATANAFQQPLNLWNLNALLTAAFFMGQTGAASAITYNLLDTLYNGWVVDFAALQSGVVISFGDSKFTAAGQAAKNILVNSKGWVITDGGL